MIRSSDSQVITRLTLQTIRAVARNGVVMFQQCAVTLKSTWLDLSMKIDSSNFVTNADQLKSVEQTKIAAFGAGGRILGGPMLVPASNSKFGILGEMWLYRWRRI